MITRDNYEEFFLLYVDNELSAAERQLVEDWVAENPDLTEEWDLLLQCRITPDPLVFMDRESLFRQGNDAMSEKDITPEIYATSEVDAAPDQTNYANQTPYTGIVSDADKYEETLLSYIDGELDEDTRQSFEELLLRDPSLRAGLASLQRTVSVADPSIVFENKEILYRKEQERRIVLFPWRMAAAALVAGVVGLLLFNQFHQGSASPVVNAPTAILDSNHPPKAPGAGKDSSGSKEVLARTTSPDNRQGAASHKELLAQTEPASTKISNSKKIEPTVTPRPSSALHLSEAGQSDRTAQVTRTGRPGSVAPGVNRKAGPRSPGVEKQVEDPEEKALAQTDPLTPARTRGIDPQLIRSLTSGVEGPGDKIGVLATPVTNHPTIRTKENSFATQALLSSSNGSADDGLVMEDSSLKKHKLRGLFRKVTRVLEKTTSRDDDDHRSVLVGSFQFALK